MLKYVLVLCLVSTQCLAGTPKGECPNLWKMYGLFMRTSLICNFPESNAMRKTLSVLKKDCPRSTEAQARRYIADGFREFDKEVASKGHPKACGEMFILMDTMGGG
ncbi:hypothetical protein LB559_16085 [Mesorhizobium sp. BR1-1-3]|uniref:hypothetical protein n=1 Tax=Mesorhizobium sp. BR1-1-3 TaxID=2876651 RepID=UPI001CD0A938|nr:hypothetical protein [Mesorhizobium sp. BR1-1-3]MBZ9889448.1 hypothetical protein [Mesorhizobium sp. BR1-1-3]